MMFKLKLDESLFDDEMSYNTTDDVAESDVFDDEFSDYEDSHDLTDVLPGPAEGSDTGVAGELIALINDEWEAIQGYNNGIATLRTLIAENPVYEDAIKVLEEIAAEENVHVGQLQEVLRRVSPNAAEINKGTAEAKTQMGLVGGVLPVQSWDTASASETRAANTIDDMCTINDIDDEM